MAHMGICIYLRESSLVYAPSTSFKFFLHITNPVLAQMHLIQRRKRNGLPAAHKHLSTFKPNTAVQLLPDHTVNVKSKNPRHPSQNITQTPSDAPKHIPDPSRPTRRTPPSTNINHHQPPSNPRHSSPSRRISIPISDPKSLNHEE